MSCLLPSPHRTHAVPYTGGHAAPLHRISASPHSPGLQPALLGLVALASSSTALRSAAESSQAQAAVPLQSIEGVGATLMKGADVPTSTA